MDMQDIIAIDVGAENTYGTCVGRMKTGPMSFCRLATDDLEGEVCAYVGQGEFTDDPVETFGGYGVAHIPDMQRLLRYICMTGFEHHVAVSLSNVAGILHEAFVNYLGFNTYHHHYH
jgi:L-fucose isomerase-like protein